MLKHYTEFFTDYMDFELPIITDNKKQSYINLECGFDIETSSMKVDGEKFAFMYVWLFGLGYGKPVYYGRTWEEFSEFCKDLSSNFGLNEQNILPVYVHNLGYEFQFMRKYFNWVNVFSASERKPIKALTDLGIEFKCSYILSGYSLANVAKNLSKHTIKKLTGDLDYSLIRTHVTPLTDSEINYCINDIQIILAYINEQIEIYGNVSQIPNTNTGRVRKFVRDNCFYKQANGKKGGFRQYAKYHKVMQDLTLDNDTYKQLKRAFMGGFTHANANYTGKVLNDVTSIDFTSSYPSVMLSEKFPMSRFKPVKVKTIKELEKILSRHAVIFDVQFINIKPRITQETYLSESKCRNVINPVINNGRIFSADSITTTLTEIDYSIMKQCYTWENIAVSNVKYAIKNYLPKPIIFSVLDLYQKKTELKDVTGYEVEYLLSKGMLNSIYGMTVTDIVKPLITYVKDWGMETLNLADEITKYNESKNRFLYYPWGVWVTAYARRNLWTGILATGDDYIYSDTDSLKILNYEKYKPYIEHFDNQIINKMIEMCDYYDFDLDLLAPVTKDGKEKIIGIWDLDGHYKRFKTLGAKRYLYEDGKGLHLTVAGLSKQNGVNYMLEKCDNDTVKVFEMFNDKLFIPSDRTGKMTHTYIDHELTFLVTDYLGNTTEVTTLTGVHLENCEFTLSISDQFKTFLNQLSKGYIYKGVKHL